MNYLYAPWRSIYSKSVSGKQPEVTEKECVFCTKFADQEHDKHFILKQTKNCAVVLNLYPYNAGHLLILPLAHKQDLSQLSYEIQCELMALIAKSVDILKKTLNAEGINVGLNLGKSAGAGIPSHLHFHVLPRWQGDTNFLPTLAETKQISFDLHEIYNQLKPEFDKLN